MSGIWLNIGCGKKHLNGFINMDVVKPYDKKLDARKGLPYPDSTVDGVYSEHFFEHLTQAEGLGFLRECRRVLKPGGVVRIAMPDLDELVRRYGAEDWRADGDMFKLGFDWVANRCEMMNIAMREWGHKHLYNEEELIRVAQIAGLRPVKRFDHGISDTNEFVGLETRNSSKLIMEFVVPDRSVSNMPLVSVLIPTYRATYFQDALNSALAQTYKNIEIIVCDDSESNLIEEIVNKAKKDDQRLRYVRNDPPEGGLGNYLKCFSEARGEFIKFLNDDDLLEPGCIEKMVAIFKNYPSVVLVTSYRKLIDEHGKSLDDIPATRKLCKHDCEIEGISCANALISGQLNFIGEPSTTMFRKVDLEWIQPHFMTFGGMLAVGAGDVAMWLNLLSQGNGYYITEPLSSFRIHSLQRQNEPNIKEQGVRTWQGFVFHGHRLGLVKPSSIWSIKVRYSFSDSWTTAQINITPRAFRTKLREYAANVYKRYMTRTVS